MSSSTKFTQTDPQELLARIKNTFPDLSWSDFDYVTEGWDHEVIILDTQRMPYAEVKQSLPSAEVKKLVFRFPGDEEYGSHLRTEIELLKWLRPLVAVPVPDYKYIAPDFSFAGYPYIIGTPLMRAYFTSLPANDIDEIATQLAGFLTTLHTLDLTKHDMGKVRASTMKADNEDLRIQVTQYLESVLSPAEFAVTQEIVREMDALQQTEFPRLFVHGDVYSNHLLWNDQARTLGIIDFSDMNMGDPAFDFAELFTYGDEFILNVFAAYKGIKDDLFLQRSWTYQRWMGVFMMVDHFLYHKTSFEVARETFDRIKNKPALLDLKEVANA